MKADMRTRRVSSDRLRTVAALAVAMTLSPVLQGSDAVVVPDPKNPGYYKPFACVAFRPGKGPFGEEGRITNNCGHAVEVHFHDGKTNNMATVGAGEFTTAYVPLRRGPIGCVTNDGFNWSLQLCHDGSGRLARTQPQPAASGGGAAAADQLAKELGISGSGASMSGTGSRASEADQLAAELGIESAGAQGSGRMTAGELERSLADWNAQKKSEDERRQREAAELARLQAERERIDRERQLAYEREQRAAALAANQQSRQPSESERRSSIWGALGTAAATFGIAKGAGLDTASALQLSADSVSEDEETRSYVPSRSGVGPNGNGCESANDALQACVVDINEEVGGAAGPASAQCRQFRSTAQCAARVASSASACPTVVSYAREMQRAAESQAASSCAERPLPAIQPLR